MRSKIHIVIHGVLSAFFLCICNVFFGHVALAAWNLPSCNPDAVGPTDSSCNVSAPLNVSSSSQTKSGQLTIQNTVNAGDLVVSNAYSGSGTVTITTSSGKSLNVTHSDSTASAITVDTNSNQAGVAITQSGTGTGFSVSATTGLGASIINNSSSLAALSASNTNASAFGAIKACNSSSNCAVLGSLSYSANFDGAVTVGVSGVRVSASPAFTVYGSGAIGAMINDNANSATALSVAAGGTSSTGISVTATNMGIDVPVSGGAVTGVHAYGTTDGVYGFTASGSGVTGSSLSTGVGVSGSSSLGKAGEFSSGSSGTTVVIQNTSSGEGLDVETGGVTAASITDPTGFSTATGQGIRGTSANSYGVTGYSTASSGYGVGVYGRASSDYGVVAISDAKYGMFASSGSSSYYGSVSCNAMTANCAYLGGGTYAGNFTGRTYTSASTTTNPVATIYNTNTTGPNYGFALSARTMTGTLTPITVTQGTAIDAQAYNGFGLSAYSQNGIAGVYGEAGSTSGYGGFFAANGATARAVYGTNTYSGTGGGYGGYFTTNSDASTALYASNLNNTAGTTKYGLTAIALTSSGVAVHGIAQAGIAGEFVSTSGGTGIHIDGAGSAVGIDVDVSDFDPAITVGGGTISSTGGFIGGQFYPNEPAGNGVIPNINVRYSRYLDVSIPAFDIEGMAYDGSQLWISYASNIASTGKLQNIDIQHLKVLNDYDTAITDSQTKPLYADGFAALVEGLWVFSQGSDDTTRVDRLNGNVVNGTVTVDVATGFPRASTYDGDNIWIGTTVALLKYSSSGAITNVMTTGTISDMISTSGYIWSLDTTNDVVHKTLSVSPYTDTEISTGNNPRGLVYDGQHVWIVNYDDDTLTRINASTNTTTTYDISALGSNPTSVVFDGARIWIGFENSGVGYFNIASESVGDSLTTLCSACGAADSSIDQLLFDGTYIWALDNSGPLYQIPTGTGFGFGEAPIIRGQLMYNTSGDIYCGYVSGAGTWVVSTTLTQCQ